MASLILIILGMLIIGCTKKEYDIGDAVPPIYGGAYYMVATRMGVCYPIPFNIIIGLLYRLYRLVRSPKFVRTYNG